MNTIQIVRNAFQALASQDPDRIAAVLTGDAEWLSPPGNATSVALDTTHHMVGRKAIVRFFSEDLPRLFVRDVVVAPHGIHGGGAHVTLEAAMTATLASGNPYDNDFCFVVEVRDGLVHRVREYTDTARGHRLVFGEVHSRQPRSGTD